MTINSEEYYALAIFDEGTGELRGLHYNKGMPSVYAHLSSAKQVRTRMNRMSGKSITYKIVKFPIEVNKTTLLEGE